VPVVLGHEFGGHTDDGVLVAVLPHGACGSCPVCLRGRENLCPTGARAFHGSTIDGGLADEVLVDRHRAVAVPAGADPAVVALVEPIAVAVHAVERAALRPGERVLVVGGGSIGLLCAAVLVDRGIAVDLVARHAAQRAAAEALGAGVVASGRYDVVIDAAGTPSSMEQAVRAGERGGRIVLVALPWAPVPLSATMVLKEVTVVPAIFYTRSDFEAAASVLARQPSLPGVVVTHRFGLEDATSAFGVAADRAAGAIKVHLLPV
jgi:2-desacetyl-2-hydroxyethyl bacteriochlorophyllide A dehydrogenase